MTALPNDAGIPDPRERFLDAAWIGDAGVVGKRRHAASS